MTSSDQKYFQTKKYLRCLLEPNRQKAWCASEVADCSKKGEKNLIQNLKDFQSIATPLFGRHVEGMFARFIEKLEDAAQELGINR